MEFDLQMIKIACMRCENYNLLNMMDSKTKYCTMRNSINLCNIEAKNRLGKYKKYPTQTELHQKLFNCIPEIISRYKKYNFMVFLEVSLLVL